MVKYQLWLMFHFCKSHRVGADKNKSNTRKTIGEGNTTGNCFQPSSSCDVCS